MDHSELVSAINGLRSHRITFLAVQGGSAVTCVDWQAFHCWQDNDPAFTGLVTVMDDSGGQVTMADWAAPNDHSADISLTRTGWHRVAPWAPDPTGRRSAPVQRTHTLPLRVAAAPGHDLGESAHHS